MIEKNTGSLPDSSFKSAQLDLNGRLWELKEERKILFDHSGDALSSSIPQALRFSKQISRPRL